VDAVTAVEEDFVRVWPETRVLAETELVEAFRRCLDWTGGGLERSVLTGSVLEAVLELRLEEERCKPPVVGLPMLAREGGGRIEGALLVTLPFALGGREDVVRTGGLTGSRLGDRLDLSVGRASNAVGSARDLSFLLPRSPAGLRRERVREGILDMVLFTRRVGA
jgi:hypothetical protein